MSCSKVLLPGESPAPIKQRPSVTDLKYMCTCFHACKIEQLATMTAKIQTYVLLNEAHTNSESL